MSQNNVRFFKDEIKIFVSFVSSSKESHVFSGSSLYLHIFSLNDVFQIELFVLEATDAFVVFFANPRNTIYNAIKHMYKYVSSSEPLCDCT